MNSHFRSIENRRRLKKLYEKTFSHWSRGAWFDREKNRYIRIYSSDGTSSCRVGFYKKHSNRIVRKSEICGKGNLYRKMFDYQWAID